MKKAFYTLLILSFQLIVIYSSAMKVEPSNWWIGMENNELQLLIYEENISSWTPRISYDGVTILNISRVENPNYLFLNIKIDQKTKPGEFEIRFKKGRKKKSVDYSLEYKRPSAENSLRSIKPSDTMYLLMPDRFANDDPANDIQIEMNENHLNRSHMFHRHGGDIAGIQNRLDYLKELGITALWLNPVVENNQPKESYHGYAATDLYSIDARFGSNDDYKELVKEIHKRDMKMVMDVVYNHWGNEHWIIKDLPDSSWVNQWDEFTRTNYRATTLMDPYSSEIDSERMKSGWFDHHMPDLNQQNKLLSTYLIQNSIWWIEEFEIDAFRIDTYAYPDQNFMNTLLDQIHAEYPSFFCFGETWVHGTPIQNWFTGKEQDKLDAVTDFQLYYALKYGLNEPNGWEFGISRVYYTLVKDYLYKEPSHLVTFLDNHDLSRWYSIVNEDKDKFKLGLGMLYTLRGIPCIYYGTEIGMKNHADPDGKVREDFPGGWEEDEINKFERNGRTQEENELHDFVSKLGEWRKSNTSLINQTQAFKHFVPENGIYVYGMDESSKDNGYIVLINTNQESALVDLQRFNEILEGYGTFTTIEGKVTLVKGLEQIELPPMSFNLIQKQP